MSKPTIRVNAGIYELVWLQEQVAIRVDRLHENSGSSLTGEILVKSLLPGMPSHLHQARLNLTSTAARRTLAKHLEERNPEAIWADIVEQACVLVLQSYREGEPVLTVNDIAPRQGSRFRLDPFVLEGHPNMIFGAGGVGKSLLAVYFAVLVSAGHHRNGLSPMPGNVLYLDYETSPEELRERVAAIEAGLGEPGFSNIFYRFSHQPIANDIEQIQRIVSDKQIEFVVIDSMGPACGADPNSPEAVIAYFTALRSLRIASLTIDHVAKNANTPTPYGSVYKTNLCRSVYAGRPDATPAHASCQDFSKPSRPPTAAWKAPICIRRGAGALRCYPRFPEYAGPAAPYVQLSPILPMYMAASPPRLITPSILRSRRLHSGLVATTHPILPM